MLFCSWYLTPLAFHSFYNRARVSFVTDEFFHCNCCIRFYYDSMVKIMIIFHYNIFIMSFYFYWFDVFTLYRCCVVSPCIFSGLMCLLCITVVLLVLVFLLVWCVYFVPWSCESSAPFFCNLQSRARIHAVLVISLYELLGNPTT